MGEVMMRGVPFKSRIRRNDGKRFPTINMISTEAESLDEALDMIRESNRHKRISETQKLYHTNRTLKQTFVWAKCLSSLREKEKKRVKKEPIKHPLKDLTLDEKKNKVIEFYKSGYWGLGTRAIRKLARAFNLTIGQVATWLDGIEATL